MANAQQFSNALLNGKQLSWSSVMMGYAKRGKPRQALLWYAKMRECDGSLHPSAHAFVSLLKSCAKLKDVESALRIHAHIDRCKLLEVDPFVGSALVDMYVKVGLLSKAKQVFLALPLRDVVSWTALISGYADHGFGKEALQFFDQMQCQGVLPNSVTFTCGLKACAMVGALEKGQEMHSEIARKGLDQSDVMIGSTLVHMYAKCGSIAKAQALFDSLPSRNDVSCNALIAGYAEHGHDLEALTLFKQMLHRGMDPNPMTYVYVLGACGNIQAVIDGQEIHAEVERKGLLESNNLIGNILVEMYAKCGMYSKAKQLIDHIPVRNVTSWTALIKGYTEQGHGNKALMYLELMQIEGIPPNAITLIYCLKSCYLTGANETGEGIFGEIERRGLLQSDQLVGNALVDMYAKQGLLVRAREVLNKLPTQSVIPWTALISGYVDHGRAAEALECFEEMKLMNVSPNAFTLVCILKACANIRAVEKGREIRAEIDRRGLLQRDIFIGNALVDMYVKFGFLAQAQEVFDSLTIHDVVSWTALIGGYVENGFGEEALSCFEKMQQLDRVSPNRVTFICGLKACTSIGAIDKGIGMHAQIEKKGLERDTAVGNTLVNMYARCGSPGQAREIFDKLLVKDTVAWTSLIGGYAQIGESQNVFDSFESMVSKGIAPNEVTFVTVLSACRHAVSFETGKSYFDTMKEWYGISPDRVHYTCLIDLYGRTGELESVLAMMKKLPFCPSPAMWQALMHSCRKWGNEELGKQSFQTAMKGMVVGLQYAGATH